MVVDQGKTTSTPASAPESQTWPITRRCTLPVHPTISLCLSRRHRIRGVGAIPAALLADISSFHPRHPPPPFAILVTTCQPLASQHFSSRQCNHNTPIRTLSLLFKPEILQAPSPVTEPPPTTNPHPNHLLRQHNNNPTPSSPSFTKPTPTGCEPTLQIPQVRPTDGIGAGLPLEICPQTAPESTRSTKAESMGGRYKAAMVTDPSTGRLGSGKTKPKVEKMRSV